MKKMSPVSFQNISENHDLEYITSLIQENNILKIKKRKLNNILKNT